MIEFPIFVGKHWKRWLVEQEFPHSKTDSILCEFTVIKKEPYEYQVGKFVESFVVEMVRETRSKKRIAGYFHYISAQGDFPGNTPLHHLVEIEQSVGKLRYNEFKR